MRVFCILLFVFAAASGAPSLGKLLGVKKAIKEHLFGGHDVNEHRGYSGYGHHYQMASGYVPNGYTGVALPSTHHLVSNGHGGAVVSNPQIVYVQNGDRRVHLDDRGGDYSGFYGYQQPHGGVLHSGIGHPVGGHHYGGSGGGGHG